MFLPKTITTKLSEVLNRPGAPVHATLRLLTSRDAVGGKALENKIRQMASRR